jgi:hypothetical protein
VCTSGTCCTTWAAPLRDGRTFSPQTRTRRDAQPYCFLPFIQRPFRPERELERERNKGTQPGFQDVYTKLFPGLPPRYFLLRRRQSAKSMLTTAQTYDTTWTLQLRPPRRVPCHSCRLNLPHPALKSLRHAATRPSPTQTTFSSIGRKSTSRADLLRKIQNACSSRIGRANFGRIGNECIDPRTKRDSRSLAPTAAKHFSRSA